MVRDLTKGKVLPGIISFSIPILLGNVFQQLYNMADSIIVGRFVGKEAFAAVGSTGSLNFLIIGFVLGVSCGLCIPVSQRFGAGDIPGMRKKIVTAAYISIILALVLTIGTVLGVKPLLTLMQTPDNIFKDAYIYIGILFLGIPATFLYNLPANILRSLGDSKTPLYFLIISAVINVILDIVFVAGFSWGVAGTGIATVMAQFLSGILCIIYIHKKYDILRFEKEDFAIQWDSIHHSFAVGVPMGLQFSITAVGSVILQSAVNTLGSDVVASVNAGMKIQMIMVQPMEALGATMATFSGQNIGAGHIERIREGVKKGIMVTAVCAAAAFLIVNPLAGPISLLFMKREEMTPFIMGNIQKILFWNSCFYFFLGSLLILRNTLQGIGKSVIAMGAGLFEMIARSIIAFGFVLNFGFTAICFANPAAWMAATFILIPLYIHMMNRIKIQPEPRRGRHQK